MGEHDIKYVYHTNTNWYKAWQEAVDKLILCYFKETVHLDTKNKCVKCDIEKVIFNEPATIIMWKDGSKTVVKCQDGDMYDKEKGFVMAYLKRLLGNDNTFNKEIKKHVPPEDPHTIRIRHMAKNAARAKQLAEQEEARKKVTISKLVKAINVLEIEVERSDSNTSAHIDVWGLSRLREARTILQDGAYANCSPFRYIRLAYERLVWIRDNLHHKSKAGPAIEEAIGYLGEILDDHKEE